MITRPIIPIWIMSIFCIVVIALIIMNIPLFKRIKGNNKTSRQKKLKKEYIIDVAVKIIIIVILFIINLRFMIPNGESTSLSSDLNILFVIDTSISMQALDYNGKHERMDGVKEACEYIIDELGNAKYSVISFDDTAKKVIPFTTDSNMVKTAIKVIRNADSYYAKGSSLNIVKDVLKKTITDEEKSKDGKAEFVVFFISDGEITKEGEKLDSYAGISKNIINGAVLGFGTDEGGRMIDSRSSYDNQTRYLKYYDRNTYDESDAISKIDENNLKKVATDLGVDYIKVNKKADLNTKLRSVKEDVLKSSKSEKKDINYQDTYYYLAIPLTALLIVELLLQKKRYM